LPKVTAGLFGIYFAGSALELIHPFAGPGVPGGAGVAGRRPEGSDGPGPGLGAGGIGGDDHRCVG